MEFKYQTRKSAMSKVLKSALSEDKIKQNLAEYTGYHNVHVSIAPTLDQIVNLGARISSVTITIYKIKGH